MRFDQDKCVDALAPRLYRYFYLSFSSSIAGDLVQETLLRLWQKIKAGQVKKVKREVEMYAFGIARNIKKEQKRKYVTSKTLDGEYLDNVFYVDETEDALDSNLRLKQLREAMAQLKDIERDILSMMIDRELKLEEIALILEMPLGTVKSHIFRSKESLKRILLTQIGNQYG